MKRRGFPSPASLKMAGESGAEDLESRVDSRSRPAETSAARGEREEPLRSLQSRAASYLRGITPGTPGLWSSLNTCAFASGLDLAAF